MKVKINGKIYNFFNNIAIDYNLDSVASVFSFSALFNPDNLAHKTIFKPLSYNLVQIYSNDNILLLTGTLINTALGSNYKRELQQLSGYSKSGILEDITIPYSSYPLEKNDVNLEDLVKGLISDFNLDYVIEESALNDSKIEYKKTVAEPSETIKNYIAKLSAQRNIILSHNAEGNLVFSKPSFTDKPKMLFNTSNSLKMTLNVSGQSIHSEISVIRQPNKNNSSLSGVDTIVNSLVGLNRPTVKILTSGTETETKKAAENLLAQELKAITFTIISNKIYDLKCGDLVEVINPEVYLYNRAKLVISSISVRENENSEEMTLTLLMPESFTGENPKNIFE